MSVEDKLAADRRSLEQREALWARFADILGSMVDKVEAAGALVSISGDLDISLSGTKEAFTLVLRALRTNGYEAEPEYTPPASNQSYWSSFFKHPELDLRVWFTFSSTVCRRVVVGKETIEIDKYEVRCD